MGQLGGKSSKRVQTGEPIALVPDLRHLIDSIRRTEEPLPGATQWNGDPIKDSNPLRNRDRHQVKNADRHLSESAGDHTPSGPDQPFGV